MGQVVHDPICPVPAIVKMRLFNIFSRITGPAFDHLVQELIANRKYHGAHTASVLQESIRRYGESYGN